MEPAPEGRRNGGFSPGKKLPNSGFLLFPAFRASIRARILVLVLLALLPALILTWQSAHSHRNQITRQVNAETLRLSRFLASSLDRDVQSARIFLSALAQRAESQGSSPPLRCPELIGSLDIRREIYDAVGMTDSLGRIVCQAPTSTQARLDSSEWFRSAKANSRFSVGYDLERAIIGKVTMDFGFPVSAPGGAMVGLYYCALDLEWLNRLADRLQLPEGAALTVTDRGGRTLVRYPHPELWVGKNYPDSPLSRSMLDKDEGVLEAPGLDGVVRLYAFSHVGDGGLTVRIGIPLSTAYAEADAGMLRSMLAMGALAILTLALAWSAGHFMVVRQVKRLVAATRSLAAGDLEARTGMDHQAGELGQLARAFDEMAESLEWRLAQLRESESERSQSESRFSEIVERAPDAILGVDGDLSLFFCNLGGEQMFGQPRGELEGHGLAELTGRGGADAFETLVSALRDPHCDRVRATLVRGDGTPMATEVAVARAERQGKWTYTLIVRKLGD